MKLRHLKSLKSLCTITVMLSSLFFSHAGYAQSSPYFAHIPLSISEEVSLPLRQKILLDVRVYAPDSVTAVLSNWRGIAVSQQKDNESSLLSISLSDSLESASEPTPEALANYKASTFVIDFEEDSVQRVVTEFLTEYSREQAEVHNSLSVADDIEKFMASYISQPSYIHSFSFASTVAKSKSGDCTEYSVLAAAIARALAIPARVIIGTVIVEDEDTIEAYGHAWNEVWLDGRWHRIDAAMHGTKALKMFYLPAHIVDNEGLGYALGLSNAILNMPERITVRSER